MIIIAFALPDVLGSRRFESRSSAGELLQINDDGGWCWFQDERALFLDHQLIVGSVAAGSHDRSRRGNLEVSALDLDTGRVVRSVLHAHLQRDDHAAPALLARPDGRILAVYSKHGADLEIRYRITSRPGDITEWEEERSYRILPTATGVTYSNVYRLAGEGGRIYDFYRGPGFDPNVLVSDDEGRSWQDAGRLLAGPGRPYLRYASNHRDAVHFVCTEQHPRDFDNSLYHGVLRQGVIYNSFGEEAGRLGSRPAVFEGLTRIFKGDADNVAWPADVGLDEQGKLSVVYSVQKDGASKPPGQGGLDLRYRYAWFDGTQWRDHQVAFAGSRLYAGEDDYSGLICLLPRSLDTVYFSANVDPATGEPLLSKTDGQRHYELFKGVTADRGETWTITALTQNSTQDQLRPKAIGGGPSGSALIWLRGKMTTFTDYDLDLAALIPAP